MLSIIIFLAFFQCLRDFDVSLVMYLFVVSSWQSSMSNWLILGMNIFKYSIDFSTQALGCWALCLENVIFEWMRHHFPLSFFCYSQFLFGIWYTVKSLLVIHWIRPDLLTCFILLIQHVFVSEGKNSAVDDFNLW